jgi:serine/threonine protein kinase
MPGITGKLLGTGTNDASVLVIVDSSISFTKEQTVSHKWEDRWKRGEKKGKGGQGITHMATSIAEPATTGVLKILKNNQSMQARVRMRREVTRLQALSALTQSVPKVIEDNTEYFQDLSVPLYVVMEYMPGDTLDNLVAAKGPLTIENSIELVSRLCEIVGLAHDNETVHRDIKPDNIIVRNNDISDPVLVDYGLSFNVDDEHLTELEEQFRSQFLALPEHCTPGSDKHDKRSDVTALAAILYYCLTGNSPGQLFDGSGALPHRRPGRSLSDRLPDSAERSSLDALFVNAFQVNIDNRLRSAADLAERLRAIVSPSATPSDPIQLAAMLTSKVHVLDRKTIVAKQAKAAIPLAGEIQRIIKSYHKKLGAFELTNYQGSMHGTSLQEGMDSVHASPSQIKLKLTYHDLTLVRQYRVGSIGDECILFVFEFKDSKMGSQTLGVREIAKYVGPIEQIFELMRTEFAEWLAEGMKTLYEQVDDKG